MKNAANDFGGKLAEDGFEGRLVQEALGPGVVRALHVAEAGDGHFEGCLFVAFGEQDQGDGCPVVAGEERCGVEFAKGHDFEAEVHVGGGVGWRHSEWIAANVENGLDDFLAVDSNKVDIVFGPAEAEVRFARGLEFDVVEFADFVADDHVGAVFGDSGLLGGEVSRDAAPKQRAAHDAVAVSQQEGLQGDVVVLRRGVGSSYRDTDFFDFKEEFAE